MKIVLLVGGALFFSIAAFVVYRWFAFQQETKRQHASVTRQIDPVITLISQGKTPPLDEIMRLSRQSLTRANLYWALHKINRADLFPQEYRKAELIAESELVFWLTHPAELGAAPDEIALVTEVKREEGTPPEKYRFFVFKFRMHPPHDAAKDGWMVGMAGPYWDRDEPMHAQGGVFSGLESFDSHTPEEHLARMEQIVLGSQAMWTALGVVGKDSEGEK